MPRPPKSDGEKRNLKIEVRVTPAEKKQLWKTAGDAGLSPSDFLRSAMLKSQPLRTKPTPDRTALIKLQAELGKIGSNINQIAHVLNTNALNGEAVGVPDAVILGVLDSIDQLITTIQQELKNGH